MLLTLIAVHLLLGALGSLLVRLLGRNAFAAVALAPAAAFAWALSQAPVVLGGGSVDVVLDWIPTLKVRLDFHVGLLQWLMVLVVTGIGALVLFYCRWYFDDPPGRTLGLLVAFAGAMLGLVTADDLVVLYVFWELTTVFSYLMIGHDSTRRANRGAAMTALIVTTTGGLAMLVGIVTLGVLAGTTSLQAILAAPPPARVAVTASALLMLVGAISKSALAPFHFWLPGAMAAPTPVSAYLHAATMVKAGVYLIAALAPVFAVVPLWRESLTVLGATTMVLGGWRALRQADLKLLLAYGTVSQLGFIALLVGIGTKATAQAGLALLLAHALFKATLFLAVGVIDQATGTRDIGRLSGLARRLPALAVVTGLAAASMAGLPPLFGFVAKESALDALVMLASGGDGTGLLPAPAVLLVSAVVAGSMLTAAYSLRFWWGAFGDKKGVEGEEVRDRPAAGFLAAPVLLGVACLVGGFFGAQLTDVLAVHVAGVTVGAAPHKLALWHGFTVPLGLSALALAGGAVLFANARTVAAVQDTFPAVPAADEVYRAAMRGIDWLAVDITARTQRGSLASYVATVLAVFVAGVGGTLMLMPAWPSNVRAWDTVAQPAVGLVMCVAAVSLMGVRGRMRAVLTLGVTGYGTALLFLLHGAPDVALTQVLVETASLLVFLLVLRNLPKYFTDRPLHSTRWWRILLAVGVGGSVTASILVNAAARVHRPASDGLARAAYEFGYGKNVVNVILVDTRAWDTLGELTVLVVAATGVASLIFLRTRVAGGAARAREDAGGGAWLRGTASLDPAARSLVFEVTTRLLFGVLIVASVYLLIIGHNWPGGGFAGGLLAGLALLVRYLAAGAKELEEAAPIEAGPLLGAGLFIAVGSALVPWAVGGRIFQSYDLVITIPGLDAVATPWGVVNVFGDLHLVSSTVFDIGVYLVVVGVILDFVRSLGAGIDAQAAEQRTPVPRPESTTAVPAGERRDRAQ